MDISYAILEKHLLYCILYEEAKYMVDYIIKTIVYHIVDYILITNLLFWLWLCALN